MFKQANIRARIVAADAENDEATYVMHGNVSAGIGASISQWPLSS
jgi:hypothetical protein